MIESQLSINIIEHSVYSIGKIITPQVMTALFGGVPNSAKIIEAESPLLIGLGGSLLNEVFSAKTSFLYIIYPFIAILYLELINYIRMRTRYFGVLVFIFYLTSTHSFMRGGIIFVSMEPIYYALYAASWYWITKMIFIDYPSHRYQNAAPVITLCIKK